MTQETHVPSAEQVCAAIAAMTPKQLDALAAKSGVPVTTLLKIKYSETANPRIQTVSLFWPHVAGIAAAAAAEAAQ